MQLGAVKIVAVSTNSYSLGCFVDAAALQAAHVEMDFVHIAVAYMCTVFVVVALRCNSQVIWNGRVHLGPRGGAVFGGPDSS